MKLRSIVAISPRKVPALLWSRPVTNYSLIDLEKPLANPGDPHRLRMMHFKCNTKATSGYSALVTQYGVLSISAHEKHWEKELYIDTGFPFIHMPIGPNEYIIAIWSISYISSPDVKGIGLLVVKVS